MTQIVNTERVKVMTNDIKKEKIDIIAEELPIPNGNFIPAYGLYKLI